MMSFCRNERSVYVTGIEQYIKNIGGLTSARDEDMHE